MDIAERQGISGAYLEQLIRKLKRFGLLQSVRGPGGGYQLERDYSEINVSEIIAAVGEGVDATRCHGTADCQDGERCLTHDLWSDLSQEIDNFLGGITLASLVDRREIQHVATRQDQMLIRTRRL